MYKNKINSRFEGIRRNFEKQRANKNKNKIKIKLIHDLKELEKISKNNEQIN